MVGIVIDGNGNVPEHVRQAKAIAKVSKTGTIDDKIPLEGIEKAMFAGHLIFSAAAKRGIKKLYTGRKMLIRWLYYIKDGISNYRVEPGSSAYDIAKIAYSNSNA